jgi:hypothetical protein
MLARSFKTAKELNISASQHTALVGVLGMLERNELQALFNQDNRRPRLKLGVKWFDMSNFDGPACCIGGWCDRLYGTSIGEQYSRLNGGYYLSNGRISWKKSKSYDDNLSDLLFVEQGGISAASGLYSGRLPHGLHSISTAQAAQALSNYLTTGKADWHSVLNACE